MISGVRFNTAPSFNQTTQFLVDQQQRTCSGLLFPRQSRIALVSHWACRASTFSSLKIYTQSLNPSFWTPDSGAEFSWKNIPFDFSFCMYQASPCRHFSSAAPQFMGVKLLLHTSTCQCTQNKHLTAHECLQEIATNTPHDTEHILKCTLKIFDLVVSMHWNRHPLLSFLGTFSPKTIHI